MQERFTAENFAIISHTNINSKLDLFPDNFHPNKLGVLLTSTMFDVFQNWIIFAIQNDNISLNTTRNKEDVPSSFLLTTSINSNKKDHLFTAQ